MKAARIAAHHALAAMIFRAFQAHSVSRWQFHIETAVSNLRAIPVPLDLYDLWNRVIDDLEEPDSDTDRLDRWRRNNRRTSRGFGQLPGPFLGAIGRCSCWN